jgi:Cu-Zn family superoxide dismutase
MKTRFYTAVVIVAGIGMVAGGCSEPSAPTPSEPAPTTNSVSTPSSQPTTDGSIASVVLSPASDSKVQGTVTFIRQGTKTRVEAKVTGLTPGSHGFHIHEKGDCSAADGSSAGGHFNPTGASHGGPDDASHHAGDLGNLEADNTGSADYTKTFDNLAFDGDASIIGKAVIVHGGADDLKSQPSGNAGNRVACGVIERK